MRKIDDHDIDGTLPYFVRDRIERLLIDLGGPRPITHGELAARLQPPMDEGQLSRLLNGQQRVRLDSLQRIAKGLGVPLATLFDGTREPVSNIVELASLLTTHHQDTIRALGELARAAPTADRAAEASARRIGEADRKQGPARRSRSK